ncbi:Transposable element Tc3 transposase [Anthophora retusa]
MTTFSNAEYADILFMYGKANGNASGARSLYQERFPQKRVPNVQVFTNTYRRIRETGSVHHQEPGVTYTTYAADVDEQILEAFEADPTTSIRTIAHRFNVSIWKVWSVLNAEGKHPFRYTSVQALEEGDLQRKTLFCWLLLNADMEDRLFLRSIVWTDESKFSHEGITNFHNLHYWSDAAENPHVKRQTSFQRKFSVNVWAGVIGKTLIGPYYLPDNLNGDNYLVFLKNVMPDILDEVPLNVRNQIIFQNDGCPAHQRLTVRNFLNEQFPNRWIGRSGPILWPPRSPDLTPVYYVWGCMKDLVYAEEIRDKNHLIRKIEEAATKMKQEMKLGITTSEIRRRARFCIRHNGSHFEHQR